MALSNYEIMRNRMREEFIKYDQQKMIQKFSLQYDANYIYIDFVSRNYRVHRKNGIVEWSLNGFQNAIEADYNESMSIYDVLCCSKPGCALSGNYCTLNDLKGTLPFGGLGADIFHKDIEEFKGENEKLRKACRILGHIIQMKADVSAILYPFSFMPIIIQYWEGDDEFTSNLKFMFDENILDYMHYETIFLMMSHTISRIKETMAEV